jgi:hypothetical protein
MSTVLSLEEEAIIVAFRRLTLLPLGDCLYTLPNNPAPDVLVIASLPATAWYFQVARGDRRRAG